MALVGKDTKQPAEVLDWDIDFADWLRPGDTLDQITPSIRVLSGVDQTPLMVHSMENTVTTVKAWLSGGTSGVKYRVQLRATTVGGRTKEAEFDITVKEI